MFLDPLNPNPASVFRFDASVARYVNFVNYLKMPFYPVKRDFGMNITPDCHILHCYQDFVNNYQDRKNYNF